MFSFIAAATAAGTRKNALARRGLFRVPLVRHRSRDICYTSCQHPVQTHDPKNNKDRQEQ